MRVIIILLALAVAGKLTLHEVNYRAATEHALIAAYAEQAAEACRTAARQHGFVPASGSRASDTSVVIGDTKVHVWLWDVGNTAWAKRYRSASLRLIIPVGDTRLPCSYDMAQKVAVLTR